MTENYSKLSILAHQLEATIEKIITFMDVSQFEITIIEKKYSKFFTLFLNKYFEIAIIQDCLFKIFILIFLGFNNWIKFIKNFSIDAFQLGTTIEKKISYSKYFYWYFLI